jgi:uncharacterized membrane protein
MAGPERKPDDVPVEQLLGNLLRTGVLLAAAVVLLGGVVYLARHGHERVNLHEFRGEPEALRSPSGIVREALRGRGRGLIQLGLLLLIATPVARVVFSVFAFLRERDRTYVVITLLVLGVLLVSLFFGEALGLVGG